MGYGNNSQQDENENPSLAEKAGREPAKRGAKDGGGSGKSDLPAAGPHAEPSLTNKNATPGTGALPEAGKPDATDSTTG